MKKDKRILIILFVEVKKKKLIKEIIKEMTKTIILIELNGIKIYDRF